MKNFGEMLPVIPEDTISKDEDNRKKSESSKENLGKLGFDELQKLLKEITEIAKNSFRKLPNWYENVNGERITFFVLTVFIP
ncbi:MAG: hypothetical protein WC178_04440 [Candidatus Paceibacterota bacterium]